MIFLTVPSDKNNFSAIALLLLPSTIRLTMLSSLSVSEIFTNGLAGSFFQTV